MQASTVVYRFQFQYGAIKGVNLAIAAGFHLVCFNSSMVRLKALSLCKAPITI